MTWYKFGRLRGVTLLWLFSRPEHPTYALDVRRIYGVTIRGVFVGIIAGEPSRAQEAGHGG